MFDETTLLHGTNFTFATTTGDIDLLGEVTGIGDYAEVAKEFVIMRLFDYDIKILSLDGLIKSKRAAATLKIYLFCLNSKPSKNYSKASNSFS